MESVSKARARMSMFPKIVAACRNEGAKYAACVSANQDDLRKNACKQEFENFKLCVTKAAAGMGTRI